MARIADRALRISVAFAFLTIAAGMWLFAWYTLAYYEPIVAQNGLPGLNETRLPRAYEPAATVANFSIAAHLALAVAIGAFGSLQCIPYVRNRFPVVHRWNGRVFLVAVILASLSGFFMIWIRGSAVGGLGQHLGLSANGAMNLGCAAMAWRCAVAGRFKMHRRWALRFFIAANGFWFARVGLWLWVPLTGGAGIDWQTFTGPFLTFLSFAQFVIPLAALELYLFAGDRAGTSLRFAVAMLLLVLTAAAATGTHHVVAHFFLKRL